MNSPTFDRFKEQAEEGNLIAVYTRVPADMETPISVFRKFDDRASAYLLESVEHGEHFGRYSFIGVQPFADFTVAGGQATATIRGKVSMGPATPDPLAALRRFMARFQAVGGEDLPPFRSGAVGFVSYDLVNLLDRLPESPGDSQGLPLAYFALHDLVIAFDHVTHMATILIHAYTGDGRPLEEIYHQACERVEAARRTFLSPVPGRVGTPSVGQAEFVPRMSREAFYARVEKARQYIAAGDIFQVVLSQAWEAETAADPFNIYRALRMTNPSPYMFYLQREDARLIGSSPEILVKKQGRTVTVRPIAGTRPRGADPAADLALEKDLLADHKEMAEHIMLVDLGRDDAGRVCQPGTVRVKDLCAVERYSHVMHIVSDVTGTLCDGLDACDALRACFPAGTVSGAPKIRAMEIITELEPHRRGLYSGAVGYLSYSGDMDTCIAIRTIVMTGRRLLIQAGAGIVYDSVPEREHEETCNKARALMKAVHWAERGLE